MAAVGVASLILSPLLAITPASAAPDGSNVVINEIYARGGSANQPYDTKFVELHNPTDDAISLDGMSLQYRGASLEGDTTTRLPLRGSVPAGGYYLIAGGQNLPGNPSGEPLPAPDASLPALNLQGQRGTVVLVEGTAAISLPTGDVTEAPDDRIVDLVGYGDANVWEGSGTAETSGGNSVPQSITRTDGVDTDDNRADFTMVDVPTPQNSTGEGEGPDPEFTAIADIQGTGDATPLDGQTVTTRGVVTGVYPEGGFDGAFIQTPGTGADLEGHDASHAIFVYGNRTAFAGDVEIGDYIEVTGTAGEYFGLTQLTYAAHEVLAEDAAAPVPAQIQLPGIDEREAFESMLLAPQGDFTVTDTYHTNRFGWVGLAAGDEPLRQPTDVIRPRGADAGAYDAFVAANADREIRMDDGSSHDWTNFTFADHNTPVAYLTPANPVRVGAPVEFEGPVILDYRRTIANQDSTWAFQPQTRLTGDNAQDVQPISWENTRPAAPAEVGGDVTLATFNVLNYFTSLGVDEAGCGFFGDRQGNPTTARSCDVRGAYDEANLARQTEKIVSAINALDADVVALQEIENSRTFADGDRDRALSDLVDALNADAGDGVWRYVESPEEVPPAEDVIRNAFIYRTATVQPVGETVILIGNAAFATAREPMAQEFALVDESGAVVEDAETFVAINNHFKSKGSGTGENADQGDGQGASNPDRIRQAEALVAFADDVAEDAGTELVFLVGDFNSYTMEDPMMVFAAADYTNIAQELTDKSTYSFGSMVGSLDHVLGSEAATDAVTGADIWNINAYESIAFEYSRYNYNVTNFHDDSPYRSSDHDPILVGIDLIPEATVDINLLAFNDFHGRLFDYDVDRDTGEVTGNDTLAFAGTIEELRAEEGEDNTILFSSGDNIGASLFTSALQEDRPTIEILNALELAASAVGNHEFDGGWDNLTGQVEEWTDFPYLGANVYLRGTDDPALPEYEIVDVDGVSVAVIGVVTEETRSLVSPGGIENLDFGDPVDAVNRVAAELTDGEGDEADVIIASFHEGAGTVSDASTLEEEIAESETFASIVNDTSATVDAIFNAHTHQLYAWDAPVPGEDGAFRPVIQGGSYASHVSQVVLTVDRESGDVVDHTARNVPASATPYTELVETYERVAEVQEILDAALAEAEEIGSEVIGSATADITTAHTLDDDGNPVRDDRSSESTLGNLVADALRETLSEERLGSAEIGVVNPGGLRAELYEGDITFAEANAVLPFLNDLWTVTLTGAQFKDMLEQQWQPAGSSRSFLHLGLSDNVSYTMDPAAPRGERITSVMIDGEPLNPTQGYRIGTFSFLAQGGDNFTVFQGATEVQQTGLIDRDAWIAYIRGNSPLSPDFARRATVVQPLPAELVAGEEVSFEVTQLDLTSLGSPENTELTVYLVGEDGERGEAVHISGIADGGGVVTFVVPDGLEGAYTLEMEAAPSGTTIRVPVTVEAPPSEPEYGFFLSNSWRGGLADIAFQYGRFTDEVLIGDWDGDGKDSITVRRGSRFFVNNAPRGGPADSVFDYGRVGDVVLVGDWDGDGTDTLAVRRGHEYFVKNSLAGGPADIVVGYGRAGDEVLVGDWDGDGEDTFAVRRGTWYYVKNTIAAGPADFEFAYGRPGDVTLAGDWDGDGEDTFAVRRGNRYFVNNSLRGGAADMAVDYGRAGDEVFVGDWDGDGTDTLGVRRTP